MTKRNHIVLLSYWRSAWIPALASVVAVSLAGYAFADKIIPAKTEKTGQSQDVSRVEILRLCEPGPECPDPYVAFVRVTYREANGTEIETVDHEVIPDFVLVESLFQDLLDGGDGRPGANKQRGHGNGNG